VRRTGVSILGGAAVVASKQLVVAAVGISPSAAELPFPSPPSHSSPRPFQPRRNQDQHQKRFAVVPAYELPIAFVVAVLSAVALAQLQLVPPLMALSD
jgi:hypothetical protein